MKSYEQDIWILLTHILSNEANSSEIEKFADWLEEDWENRAFFEELQSCWQEKPDKNAVYNRFMFDCESGISKLRYKIREEEEEKASQVTPPAQQKSFDRLTGWKVAASILLVIGIISVWAGMRLWSPPMTSYKTSSLEQRIITLPDGSHIRLNKNSTISFRKGFSGSTRKVMLKGEAFFEVKHDANKPFVIHTGNAIVRDIGTSFNVKQAAGGKVVVAMKEGKAAFKAKNSMNGITSILTKDEIGILNKGQISTIGKTNIQNYLSWIQGRLVFEDMPFDKVIRQLDNIYNVHSSLGDSSLSRLKLTAYTDKTSLHEVLSMIALSLDIGYRKEGKKVVWKKEIQYKEHPENYN